MVAVLLAIRVLVAGSVHLTEDEAYYRLWAQAPALGYYDHPPMIAWWVWLGTHIVGDNPLGVRLLPIFGCAVTSILVFDLAKLAGATRLSAERAGVWYNATLLAAAGGFLAVPDAPAAFFWVVCLSSAFRALRAGGAQSPQAELWWLAAGLAAGLAALSKYSALFLGPGMLIWLVSTTSGRASLRTLGPWLALAAAAVVFALNIGWNATHHWLTFAKQFGRITPHRLAPRYLLEFLGTQFLLLNPILAAFLTRLPPGKGREGPFARAWPFVAISLPFIAYLLVHSLHDRIQPHWPAPIYPALALCAAFAAENARGAWRVARTTVPWFAFVACSLAALYGSLPLIGVPLRFDPALPVRGWDVFSTRIEAARQSVGAGWVGTTSYGLAAELADETAITAPILQVSERDRWQGLRHGAWVDTSRPGLLLDLQRRLELDTIRRCFTSVQPLGELDRGPAGERPKRYAMVLVTGPRVDLLRDGCGVRPELSDSSHPAG